MSKCRVKERRKHKRLKVGFKSAAISIDNKQFPILEMSSGGFSSHYLDQSIAFDEDHPTYLLLNGLSLIGDISIQLTWQNRTSTPTQKTKSDSSKVGFKFSGLNASQQLKLEAFLKWHTEGPVPQRKTASYRPACLTENRTNRVYTPLACIPHLSQHKQGKMPSPPM